MSTERYDEISRARKAKRRRIRRKRTLTALGVFCAVLVAILIAGMYSDTVPLDIKDGFRSVFSMGRFPADIGEAAVSEYAVSGRSLSLLTDKELRVLAGGGAQLLNAQHGMANAGLAAGRNRITVYSRSGRSLRIYNRSELLAVHTLQHPIISAAVSGSGKVAVLTQGEEYTCELHVFNKNTTPRFSWYGTEGFPVGVYASSGDTAAVISVKSEQGRLLSIVTLIDLSARKEKATLSAEGLVLHCAVESDSVVLVFADRAERINADGRQSAVYDFAGRPLLSVSQAEGSSIALAFGDNNRSEMNSVVVLGKRLQEQGVVEFKQPVSSIWLDSDRLYILTRGSLYSYAYNGTLRESYDTDSAAYAVADLGGPIVLQPQNAVKLTKERKETPTK